MPAGTTVLKALGHHALLLLLIQLCVLLATSRILGELARKFGQPPVIGELAAGVVLGPSILGAIAPGLQRSIFPMDQAQADLLSVVAWLGVISLLIVTGLETDLDLIKRKGKTALLVSLGGIIVPFSSGFGMGWLLPAHTLAHPDHRMVFALFMAVAMSISAVPVIAKVLMDMKLIRRDIGQVTLAAGMTDDTIGWILLSVVASLAAKGSVDGMTVARSVLVAVGFIGLGLTFGRVLVSRILTFIDTRVGGVNAQFSTVLVLALGTAAFTHEMGIEAVLGAFVVGILAGQAPRFRGEVGHALETVTAALLAPIFFASAGLKVHLARLAVPEVFLIGVIVLSIACMGKFIGAYLGAWAGGLGHWERLALGSGMNARGAMEIIVATVGLSLGVLTIEMYSIVVMVAIVTSLMAPPLLRWTLSHVKVSADEAERLEREHISSQSFLRSLKRVLLVVSGAPSSLLAGRLTAWLGKAQKSTEIAVLTPKVQAPSGRLGFRKDDSLIDSGDLEKLTPTIRKQFQAVETAPPTEVRRNGETVSEAVLGEARTGYDLIVMGSRPRRPVPRTPLLGSAVDVATRALFGPAVDPVIRQSPCATLVVEVAAGEGIMQQLLDGRVPRKIVVPTIGTDYSKHALEVACGLAVACDAEILLMHVIALQEREGPESYLLDRRHESAARDIAEDMLEHEAEYGRKLGAKVQTRVVEGLAAQDEIVRLAAAESADLVVMGSNLRPLSDRAFFGPSVDEVVKSCPCPVAVLTS